MIGVLALQGNFDSHVKILEKINLDHRLIKNPEDLNISIEQNLEIIKVSEPAQREAGVKVETVDELVDKLKNEAGVI